jgi:formate dehydrogenase subunit delta
MTNTPQVLDDHRLVHKVNQIALFFEPYPREAAIEGVVDHLKKFWTPTMRQQLVEFAATEQDGQLHTLVHEAAARLALPPDEMMPERN